MQKDSPGGQGGHGLDSALLGRIASEWEKGGKGVVPGLLGDISEPCRTRVLRMLDKDKIRVLAQVPSGSHLSVSLDSDKADPDFEVITVGGENCTRRVKAYGSYRDYLDGRAGPDYYYCAAVEWHLVPPDIQEAPFPKIGNSCDLDMHFQPVWPWPRVFDAMVFGGDGEINYYSQLLDCPMAKCHDLHGVPDDLPPFPSVEKDVDILISGVAFLPFHEDKGAMIHRLARDPRLRCVVIHGIMSHGEYFGHLARSKMVFCYYRMGGGMMTRALDALSMGAAALVQEDSDMHGIFGDKAGLIPYSLERGDFVERAVEVARQWPDYSGQARRGSALVRKRFVRSKTSRRLWRFLALLSCLINVGGGEKVPARALTQRRYVKVKGMPQADGETMIERRNASLLIWEAQAREKESPAPWLEMAREYLLEYAQPASPALNRYVFPFLRTAIFHMKQGLGAHPESLALHFNLIRTWLHFGQADEVDGAVAWLRKLSREQVMAMEFQADHDILPFDLFQTRFHHRKFARSLTAHWSGRTPGTAVLKESIWLSLLHYRSVYTGSVEDAREVYLGEGDFCHYAFAYAQALLRSGSPGGRGEARDILERLAFDSIIWREAGDLLIASSTDGEERERLSRRKSEYNKWVVMAEPPDHPLALGGDFKPLLG